MDSHNLPPHNVLPELVFLEMINALFDTIMIDYKDADYKETTMIYDYWRNMTMDKTLYFEEVKSIFLNEINKVRAYIGFNIQRKDLPTVHILISGENKGQAQSISMGYQEDGAMFLQDDNAFTLRKDCYKANYEATYNLLITAQNQTAVVIIYHTLRALLIASTHEFEAKGISFLGGISGNEFSLDTNLVPPHVFTRTLNVNFMYDVNTVAFQKERFFNIFRTRIKTVEKIEPPKHK